MSGGRLRRVVYVQDESGAQHMFGPTSDVPDWARARIRNPFAWTDEPAPAPRKPPPAAIPDTGVPYGTDRPQDVRPDPYASFAERHPQNGSTQAIEADGPDETPQPPPRGGRGSGAPAWRVYAERMGVEVMPDSDRDDVIEVLEQRGIKVDRDED